MRFDLAELSPAERYKLLGGLVVPRPIALVTSQDGAGRTKAAPFSFFNVLAEEPPLLAKRLPAMAWLCTILIEVAGSTHRCEPISRLTTS